MTGGKDTSDTIGLLETTIGNPVSRKILSSLSKYCERDGKNRIEVAIELFTGRREDACMACRITERIIRRVLLKGGEAFGMDEEEIISKFSDPFWGKALASTIKGVALFGMHRPFISGAPYLIVWDFTYSCNLRCKHCYANAGKPLEDELTTEEAKRAIDIFDRAGVVSIAFSGGEPLVRKDFFELAKYAADKGMYVAVATNGTLITPEMAEKMKNAGIKFVQISLDGASPETHDAFRGIDGAFEKTVEGIKNAVKAGFFVEIATTATKYNYEEVPSIIELAEKLGVNWFMLYNFVPTGRGKFMVKNDLSPEEREELLKMLYRKMNDSSLTLLSTAPQFARVALQEDNNDDMAIMPTHFYAAHLSKKLRALADFIGGCGCGRFYLAMRPNGNIEPCVFFPLTIGNIRRDDFEELWRNNKVLNELRNKNLLEGKCGDCSYRYQCGGCRARAYGYFGDYMAPDPGCIINRDKYQELLTH
ncbi:MAG TPA: radical SAM protein [Thermoplasmatales archaeon]|nr:radical SAM protein [Thermoplasmatales archaeon]